MNALVPAGQVHTGTVTLISISDNRTVCGINNMHLGVAAGGSSTAGTFAATRRPPQLRIRLIEQSITTRTQPRSQTQTHAAVFEDVLTEVNSR